jgi:enoyl-CoA hydratase
LHNTNLKREDMSPKEILYEKRGQTAWIYFNRPDDMNSININLALELDEILKSIETDKEILVLVVSGKGKAFCAGADLKEFMQILNADSSQGPDLLDTITPVFDRLRNFPKPVIAAVNGISLAGGLELIMSCDIVVAASSAKIGDAHSNFGVFPGAGGAAVLPEKIGLNRAKYLLFTGDVVSADKMKAFGLVNEVVADNELEATVQTLADKLAQKSPLVLKRMKEVANDSMDQSQKSALHHEMLCLRNHMRSYDLKEGLAAFAEKRIPVFKGE